MKRGDLRRSFLLLVISFCASVLMAQQESYKFVHYTNKEGLPSSYVKDIEQDKYGFIWLANRENVCRFDGYEFKNFPAYNVKGDVVDLRANKLFYAPDSVLIFRAHDNHYYYFDQQTEAFLPYEMLDAYNADLIGVVSDGFWMLEGARVIHVDFKTGKRENLAEYFPRHKLNIETAGTMVSKEGVVAISTYDQDIIVLSEHEYKRYKLPYDPLGLMYFDQYNNLWVSTYQGLVRVDLELGTLEVYSREQKGNRHMPHNYAHSMTEDKQGRVWIGTEGGLCVWKPYEKIVHVSRHDLMDPDGLSSNPIYAAFCDSRGNVWLGTYFSGLNVWSASSHFFNVIPTGVCNQCLGGNAVSSLSEDEHGDIWIGMEDIGINKLDISTGVVQKFPIGESEGGLSYGNIHDLFFENDHKLWIATYTGGINIMDVKSGEFTYINAENTPELMSNDIYAFLGKGDTIFIGGTGGVNIYRKSTKQILQFYPEATYGQFIESMAISPGRVWFSSRNSIMYYDIANDALSKFDLPAGVNGINVIKCDGEGNIWIGDSYTGLYCYNQEKDELKHYAEKEGFPGSWVYGIQKGTKGHIWVSTDQGLVKLDPKSGKSNLYNRDSGMPFSQFNYRSTFLDSRGNVYFGSNQGLVYFNEDSTLNYHEKVSDIVFTDFKLFNKSVKPSDIEAPIAGSISDVQEIELEYEQNVFTIEYSALNYGNQGKCHYAYYLEGFESKFNYVGNQNFATYTNLSPGEYTFKVKASLDNTSWDTHVSTIKIVVLPPFWLSGWGYMFYAIMIISILAMIYLVGARIQRSKALVQLERKERAHAVELNQIKLEFFTNISHELRTPLTLIIGPLSRLLADPKVSPTVKEKLKGIDLNAKRLLNLLNQLLEFRKIERGKEELRVSETTLAQLFANLEQSFAVTAEENGIQLIFDSTKADTPIWFDVPKVEKILINLISNALKFTDAGGKIEVIARLKRADGNAPVLKMTVRDTGKGMDQKEADKIFERFYMSDQSSRTGKTHFGSGIGLAFVQSLVSVHKGTIRVKSKLNEGTTFKVDLPVGKDDYSQDEISSIEFVHTLVTNRPVIVTDENKKTDETQEVIEAVDESKPKILLVEDNPELLEFVAGSLSESYSVIKAQNGAEGWDLLQKEQHVDLILSDVMMPVMDGFELTSKVKSSFETSHIPVILLTAKSGSDNRFEGLKTGADYYVEKPFLAHILEQNIFNVLKTRRNLIKRFKQDALMPVAELTHSESDKEFMDQLTNVIKKDIGNPDLDVKFLMNAMGLSRSMLHIKLKKIADCSATEFINTVRLKEALKYMSEQDCNVSEAAYKMGFSSPTYFTRRFKQYYGQSPREFLQKGNGKK